MSKLSHLDNAGNPAIVNVGGKTITHRTARAQAVLTFPAEVMAELTKKKFTVKKGSIFQTAILAGIIAAKKTGELIPLCHNLPLEHCSVQVEEVDAERIRILCEASTEGKTGVEMEALTGATLAALTVYDMCKALSHDIRITEIKLMEKTGGKRDFSRE